MPAITLTTIRDYATRHDLHCHCHGCGHSVRASWAALGVRYGWDTPLSTIRRRLVCRECGSRETSVRLVFNQMGGFRYGDYRPAPEASPEA